MADFSIANDRQRRLLDQNEIHARSIAVEHENDLTLTVLNHDTGDTIMIVKGEKTRRLENGTI